MKPTYILVPIDKWEAIDTADEDACKWVDTCPRVDLSEEGIKTKADNTPFDGNYDWISGYIACAKDLLNTK